MEQILRYVDRQIAQFILCPYSVGFSIRIEMPLSPVMHLHYVFSIISLGLGLGE